jgi:biofilm PGA synthesis N-glycosyltransferase PgaC
MEYNHITVIISTRNAGPYIGKCLTSALEQDYPNFDIIFIDAESTDGTYEKALQFEGSPNITVERNKKENTKGKILGTGSLDRQPKV